MSRRIVVKSEQIEETDLALEVIEELQMHSLRFNKENCRFENLQDEHAADKAIKTATKLYYQKRVLKNTRNITEALEKAGYKSTQKEVDGKIKIVAVQRVYA